MALPAMVPLRTQLRTGSPTAGDDCSAVTMLNAIRWASRGKVGPASQAQVAGWVHTIRQWSGAKLASPGAGMLFRGQTFRGYRSPNLARTLSAAGYGIHAGYLDRVPWKAVVNALRDGAYVHLPVDYGVLADGGQVRVASPTFRGGHSVALVGYELNARGQVRTWLGDPLADGRRKGIPRGWRMTHASYLAAAAAAWAKDGDGLVDCIVIRRGS